MHQHFLGGGFGRRLESDMVVPAIAASKAVGKPVKLIFTREDDMQMDFTRPLTYQKVKVGLDGNGKPVAMEHDVIGAWPTAKWGIPAFLTPAVDKQRVGDTVENLHDSFTVNGADYWYSIPTTRCATTRTSWRRARRPPASCARWRRPGPSGRWKAPWTRSPTPAVRIRWRCGCGCSTAPAPMPAATNRRTSAAPSVSPMRCAPRW